MSKVTSKLQVTIPKAIADRFHIKPGDEIEWVPVGEALRVVLAARPLGAPDLASRLKRFDEATERQRRRQGSARRRLRKTPDRGWSREELYTRGRTR